MRDSRWKLHHKRRVQINIGRWEIRNKFWISTFQGNSSGWCLMYLLWICPQIDEFTGDHPVRHALWQTIQQQCPGMRTDFMQTFAPQKNVKWHFPYIRLTQTASCLFCFVYFCLFVFGTLVFSCNWNGSVPSIAATTQLTCTWCCGFLLKNIHHACIVIPLVVLKYNSG